jgi:hypothetical protein
MTMHQWIFGVGGGLLMAAFVIFAFRQGAKVRRRQDGDGGPGGYVAGGGEGGGHGGSDGGGGH